MRPPLFLICFLLTSASVFSQQNTSYKDPTTALENFEFKAIDYSTLDSVARDYINAIEHSLYHRFDQAEVLMTKVALQTAAPLHVAARDHLLNELYFWRGKYGEYVRFADQIKEKPQFYELATQLAAQPAMQISFLTDSLLIPVRVRRHSYVIANVLLNGKPVRLVLDSGANFSIISQKLNDELKMAPLATVNVLNSVGTLVKSSVGLLDSLSFGNVRLTHVPVIYTAKDGVFKTMHADGLLGWDILQKLTYTADFKEQTLMIRKPVLDTTAEKNLFGIGYPILVVRSASGNPLNMYFDSGSNSVDLREKGAAKLGEYKTRKRPGAAFGIGKMKIGLFRYVKDFTFQTNGQSFSRKSTYLSPLKKVFLNIDCDGVISNAPFQKGRFTIDYLNNHVGYSETKVVKH
ncbi:retropepsin-like aspartic protease [Spirosoma fluviale]|uniref:Gag-polyprotein putative aspartyl protease n=1 Tax=Spirosoma fluviale TaxID=1597977 RepID=A0A286G2Q0_9BACT|nr:retropepsin-like aspartic protease [Spirosoma fluviale]SOD89449.1 gag-polyprotein putative aspartyl protease [Spirosoma fluviale]